MTDIELNAKTAALSGAGSARRQALLVTTCLAAAGAAAAFIIAYPARALAYTSCSPSITSTDSTIQSWSSGCMTVTNTGTIHTGGIAVTVTGSGQTSLSNSGLIKGSIGIDIGAGSGNASAIIVNNSGGRIVGIGGSTPAGHAILVGGTLGALTNSGSIGSIGGNAKYGVGVGALGALTSIVNSAGGVISGTSYAIWNSGHIVQISNSGSITSGSSAIWNVSTGSITSIVNSVGGVISGAAALWNNGTIDQISNFGLISTSSETALGNSGRIGTLSNSGTITASGIAVYFEAASSGSLIVNSVGGLISGSSTGVYVNGALGTLSNSGSISGESGVVIDSSGSITSIVNSVGGVIDGGEAAISSWGSIGQISNFGLISSSSGPAIRNHGTIGAITNNGYISDSGANAISNNGAIGTLTNSGTIIGEYGIANYGSITSIINSSTGLISATSGTNLYNVGSISAITNNGTVRSSGYAAIYNAVRGSGTITVQGFIGAVTNSGLISGGTAIYNAGTIGTINNSGTIQGTVKAESGGVITPETFTVAGIGVSNDLGATIGQLINSGVISGHTAIFNASSIGTLNNSGTITGPTAILLHYSTATIGHLTNSGVIAGNIVNGSGRDLTIAGGTGTVYGLLTGLSGLVGTIMDTSVLSAPDGSISIVPAAPAIGGDVTLTGNNLLNDMLILGSHKLVNTGNLQINNAISITGGFTQTSGALISGVTSPTKYGELFVSGAANVAGGSVGLTPISPALLASGQSYTLIQASSLTVSGSVTAAVSGLTASISTVTAGAFQDLVLTLGAVASTPPPTPIPPPATNWTYVGNQTGGPASPIGVLLDQIGAGSSAQQLQFQATILTYLSGLTLAQQEHALNQLSPSQLSALSNVAVSSPALNAILQHLNIFGQARGDFELASLSDDAYGDVYGEQGRGLWGKLVGGGASRTDAAAAYRSTDYGVVFGADLYRSSTALWGVSGSWLHANVTGNGALSGSTNAVDSYQLTAYGALKPQAWGGHWLISGQAAYAYNRYDQTRRIDAFAVTARAGYAGQQYLANGTVGYIFNRQGYNLTAYTGLKEVHVANAHYMEGGAGQLDMQVSALSLDSFSQEVGVKWDAVTNGPHGKLYPEVSVGWTHDYTHGPIPITGSLAGVTFVEPSKRTSADGVELGAGVNAQLKGWAIGLEYQGELRTGFQSHTAAIKANFRF